MLIGPTAFALAAALLWTALGLPTAPTSRLDVIKVALTVVAGIGDVVALTFDGAEFNGGEVSFRGARFTGGEKPGLRLP
ncbi:hypothetical protein [Lentzea sp. CC55]|uniref:hypothetical protein n=1 Tax=Lentzea sp. CC55 TaxID=2884909 RepID=UPI001F1FA3DA|nr:hypothetical protein [Lentzea sp. CC55]MCG8924705.1 hypothetical protein [Lentzea sp. CC55]